MRALVTGGAGFIGRWVVKRMIERNYDVVVLDDLSNGLKDNLTEFSGKLQDLIIGNVADKKLLKNIAAKGFDVCLHLAAQINVQESIDNPKDTFDSNIAATFFLMEQLKRHNTKMVFMSSALVYDSAKNKAITELHPLRPSCLYTASKIAGENIVLSYFNAYKFPVVVVRPFSVYGPFQKADMEGGVVSIFIGNKIAGKKLEIFGDGNQSRDFLFVGDCAEFMAQCAISDKANGGIFNIGSGKELKIKDLAMKIASGKKMVKFVPHHHPQCEIKEMVCDWSKAKEKLGWKPKVDLEQGLAITESWLRLCKNEK